MRDIYRAINSFEQEFERVHGVCINEAMTLCVLSEGELAASEIAKRAELTSSHCSKVIRSIEDKRLIVRTMGKTDKRQMYFRLSKAGENLLNSMRCGSVEVPDILKPIFEKECSSHIEE